jgi:DNA repair and recombination protein RAD52
MDWDKIKPELERKLDPAHVKPPSKFGPKGDYIEGWHAIAEANRIFGHGAWSYVIKILSQDSLAEGQNGKGEPQWQAAYTCIVTVMVGDVTREDVGFGSGFAKQIGDAIEGATKEAVTDALKRALRTFGNPFGLALYDKSRANVGVDAPPFDAPATRDRIKAAIAASPNVQKLNALWKHPKTCEAFEKLHPAMQAELTKAYTDRTAAVFQAPPDDEAA